MIVRRRALVATVPVVLLLAACGSDGGGTAPGTQRAAGSSAPAGTGAAGSSTAGGSSSAAPTSSGGGGSTAVELASSLAAAYTRTTSVKFRLDVGAAGSTITGSGSQQLAQGRVTAIDVVEQVPQAGTIRIRVVGDRTWVQFPGVGTAAKPWALATTSSSNPALRSLAGTLGSLRSQTSVEQYIAFVRAASSVREVGPTTVGGTKATRYAITVDVAKLGSSLPNAGELQKAGLSTLPVQLDVDGQGRPVHVRSTVTAAGQRVVTDFTAYDYDVPVRISAPPASQVTAG